MICTDLFYIYFLFQVLKESLNLPIWSVSVEILIYFAFFISIILFAKFGVKYAILIYFISLLIDKFLFSSIFVDCFRLFFTGVIVYYINYSIKKKNLFTSYFLFFFIFISFLGNFKIFLFTLVLLFLL